MAVPKLRQPQAGGGQDKASIPDSVILVSVTCIQGGTLSAPCLWARGKVDGNRRVVFRASGEESVHKGRHRSDGARAA